MMAASWSLSRPGLTSTSTPRSLKIATAAGESESEMRTRGGMGKTLQVPLLPRKPEKRPREARLDEGHVGIRTVKGVEPSLIRPIGHRLPLSRERGTSLLSRGFQLGRGLGIGPVEPLR